jgi:lysozyme family protein
MSQYTEEKKADILALWKNAYIIPCKEATAKKNCLAFIKNKKRYMAASVATNVPWYVIACIHQMESDCNWDRHMHNGDPLKARTVQVPAGRPVAGNPPFTWEESCIDALNYDKLSENKDWSIAKILYLFEKFNGFGYEPHNVPSPYVWAGTSVQKPGRYVADHVWDATAVSNRCGCVTMLKTLINIGEISADLSTSSNDTSHLPPTTIPKNEREIIEWRINVADFSDARGFDANGKCVCYLDTNGSIEMFYRSSLAAGAPRARVIFCELPAKYGEIPKTSLKSSAEVFVNYFQNNYGEVRKEVERWFTPKYSPNAIKNSCVAHQTSALKLAGLPFPVLGSTPSINVDHFVTYAMQTLHYVKFTDLSKLQLGDICVSGPSDTNIDHVFCFVSRKSEDIALVLHNQQVGLVERYLKNGNCGTTRFFLRMP